MIINLTRLKTTNYLVPFDFDGECFVWIEYVSETERTICAYYFTEQITWCYTLLEGDGHFSHVKILPNKKLFIVRWQNICEIRKMNESFTVEKQFKNIGEEVIAVDICYVEKEVEKIFSNDYKSNIANEKELINKKDIRESQKIYIKGDEDKLAITLLDLDGNINVYENGGVRTVLNLFEMKDISNDYKNKQFFSMGYPYYIKSNMEYYVFSSDHGVFVIKK